MKKSGWTLAWRLTKGEQVGVRNEIFTDFTRYLQGIEDSVQGFLNTKPEEWETAQWKGFFMALREKLGDGDWDRRGHGGGGSLTFRWHSKGDKYLRLSKGELAFKIKGVDETRAQRFEDLLRACNNNAGMDLTFLKRRLGERTTIAKLTDGYIQKDGHGFVDMDRTIEILRRAERIMDATMG